MRVAMPAILAPVKHAMLRAVVHRRNLQAASASSLAVDAIVAVVLALQQQCPRLGERRNVAGDRVVLRRHGRPLLLHNQ